MSGGILEKVDMRTQLAGQNRMELLLFYLKGNQQYGVNVFKVREVGPCPHLTQLPQSHAAVKGIADFRGHPTPIIDLSQAVGNEPFEDISSCIVIMTEYNLSVQGLLVRSVERIFNTSWQAVRPPPLGAGSRRSYLTAVTEVSDRIVEILDVEKVLDEIIPRQTHVSEHFLRDAQFTDKTHRFEILVVDDSSVARGQLLKTLTELGLEVITANNGQEALDILRRWADLGEDVPRKLLMMISDIEMPQMDGYTLTTEIRMDPSLKDLFILLHTSLSGVFNNALVSKVGADEFIAKFKPDALAETVKKRIQSVLEKEKK